ncbi:MAG: glycosyltransferase family 2 protein [Micrococcales bacterium]|nr:glycosyltransferase family 2 protein [Micrococcales bacterium]
MSPRVTVVVVAYRAHGRLGRCLDALAAQDLPAEHRRVVVVDNASDDGTAEMVETDYPWVDLLRSATNRGFAGGNNLALRANLEPGSARSPYVVLLNDDAVAAPTFLSALLRDLEQSPPDVGALTARILLAERFVPTSPGTPGAVHGPDGWWLPAPDGVAPDSTVRLVNSTGNQVRQDGFGTDRGWLAEATGHQPPRDVFGFCGAAACLRTEALEEVGLFDETFFMYYEDTDLSWRLRLAGWTTRYCAEAVVEHEHSASSGEGSAFFRFHDLRNRLLTVTKNAPAPMVARVVARYCLTTASIAVRRSQPWSSVRLRVRAFASYLVVLPRALRERRRTRRGSAVPRRDVARLLVPVPTRTIGGYRA